MSNVGVQGRQAVSTDYWSAWIFVCIAQGIVIGLYFETFASIIDVWLQSETFLHGFLIPLISAFLIWRKRDSLVHYHPEPCYAGLLILVVLSAGWFVADRLAIQVGTHLFAVAMLPAVLLTILGIGIARELAFPLGYLIFAVPFGEILIPYLIEFTAWFTIEALQVSGIPVVREGRFFAIPAGNFEVARACSGIRYLLATLALGTLYGYITFRSIRKRLAFFAVSLVVPILANGLRAYIIVLLAHFSDMKIAVGVDHLIYGWVFFGIVIVVLFFIGGRFHDDAGQTESRHLARFPASGTHKYSLGMLVFLSAATVASASPGSLFQLRSEQFHIDRDGLARPVPPSSFGGWIGRNGFPEIWVPDFSGSKLRISATYEKDGANLYVSVLHYGRQRQGAEAVNEMNYVVDTSAGWHIGNTRQVKLPVPTGGTITVTEYIVSMEQQQGVVWVWYDVGNWRTGSRIGVKIYEAILLLLRKDEGSSVTVVAAPVETSLSASRQVLEQFTFDWISALTQCAQPGRPDPGCSTGNLISREN